MRINFYLPSLIVHQSADVIPHWLRIHGFPADPSDSGDHVKGEVTVSHRGADLINIFSDLVGSPPFRELLFLTHCFGAGWLRDDVPRDNVALVELGIDNVLMLDTDAADFPSVAPLADYVVFIALVS